ncbi:MAG: hypothetical protein CMG59_05410 [Candidatus Marinimicrobia bacterium]|nr:hypothetical protein [Candidatus Neomarinimicrobiota bacterium]
MKNDNIDIMNSYAKTIKDKGMSVPAVFFLEMFKYLSFTFSQAMIVAGPLATIFLNSKKYYQISKLLSDRNNVENFITKIESSEND